MLKAMFLGRLAGKKKPARLPRQSPPSALARAYRTRIMHLLDKMMQAFRQDTLPKLDALSAEFYNDGIDDDLASLFDALTIRVRSIFNRQTVNELIKPVAHQIASFQANQLNKQLQSVIGVDVVGAEPWLEKEIALFTAENAALIKTLPEQFVNELEPLIARHFAAGGRFEVLAQLIEDRYQVAAGRAKVIAQDQAQKFFASLNEVRQKELGITQFTWITEKDEKVRATHKLRDGKVMSWENPAGGILPGEEVNCRCEAEPYLEDLLKARGLVD